jgi:hypothetical protein
MIIGAGGITISLRYHAGPERGEPPPAEDPALAAQKGQR